MSKVKDSTAPEEERDETAPAPFTIEWRHTLVVLAALVIGYSLWFVGSAVHADDLDAKRFVLPGLSSAVVGDLGDLVNVFIGTTKDGHVFPGATVPHGMIKAGMDTDSRGNHAGYDADPKYLVTGFSQLHDDGTGGDIPLSNFKLFPLRDCPSFAQCPYSIRNRKVSRALKNVTADSGLAVHNTTVAPDDYGEPGYFATNLSTNIHVELTATRRAALHRYTFPPRPENNKTDWRPHVIVDLTNDGKMSGMKAEMFIEPEKGRVSGGARFASSFGEGYYRAFMCVDFRSANAPSAILPPLEFGTYSARDFYDNATELQDNNWGEKGALFTFDVPAVLARVGVSFISTDQACSNAEEEIPDFDFERVKNDARQSWNELLGRFEIAASEKERDTAVLFYSSLYRSHIVPADYSGENPHWDSDEPYFDSLYCNWDTYRTLYPLMSLHDPETFARIVRSFIDVQQHEGWIPECRGATLQQHIQGGSDGDPILAEFFIKFQTHAESLGVNSEALYAALVHDAEIDSPAWDKAGRQANVWKKYGYLPMDLDNVGGLDTRQVSRTLEYAFDDFTISQVAKALGKLEDAEKYANRSRGFEYMWNSSVPLLEGEGHRNTTVVKGIKGFMQPRLANGTFRYTDPRHCTVHDPAHSTCFLDGGNRDGFYEGGPIVYSQYVPHDTARLIELQGGTEAFIRRLDYIFENDYFDSTNEPSQQIPFMYHYADRPGMSTERARQAIAFDYNTTIYGLPGNDDSGAMGSYVAFYLLGLYPLPATRQILLSSPYFPQVRIHNPLLRSVTTINAHGFEGNPANGTGGKVFVKNVTIDGKPWHSNCYLEWDAFESGATIDLELTDDQTVSCGVDASALPPSLSTGGYP